MNACFPLPGDKDASLLLVLRRLLSLFFSNPSGYFIDLSEKHAVQNVFESHHSCSSAWTSCWVF